MCYVYNKYSLHWVLRLAPVTGVNPKVVAKLRGFLLGFNKTSEDYIQAFPQLSPTQVGGTLSFSENSLSFSENFLSLFKRMEFLFQNSLDFSNFKL